jgi:hypothetical protein
MYKIFFPSTLPCSLATIVSGLSSFVCYVVFWSSRFSAIFSCLANKDFTSSE